MRIRPVFQSALLFFLVLGVYYPALFADVNSVDDQKMIMRFANQETFNLLGQFLPGSTFYYRPLLMLSFMGDKFLWGLAPSFMHLENMLLHALNAVLVFLIARRVFTRLASQTQFFPLFCALLFAFHPINTESVNWISGRSDLLATFFVLISCLFLIRTVENRRPMLGLMAGLFLLFGVMSKEVMLFFLPAGCFLLWRWPAESLLGRGWRLKNTAWFGGPFILGAGTYIVARFVRFGAGDSGINYILEKYFYTLFDTTRVIFKVFGFYVKKLYVPVPLNFAITSANDNYVWLGMVALVGLVVLVYMRHLVTDILAVSFYLILPAVIIALTTVAWTPLAERYLYLPSAFWSVGMGGLCHWSLSKVQARLLVSAVAIGILVCSALVTIDRNLIWQSNLSLFQDTVQKNPGFPPVRNELAIALLNEGRDMEAQEQLAIAASLDPDQVVRHLPFNQAVVLARAGEVKKARKILAVLIAEDGDSSLPILKNVAKVNEELLRFAKTDEDRREIMQDLLWGYEMILEKTEDPFIYYRSGQLALLLGNHQKAADLFMLAHTFAPASAHYREAAQILAKRLSGNDDQRVH